MVGLVSLGGGLVGLDLELGGVVVIVYSLFGRLAVKL